MYLEELRKFTEMQLRAWALELRPRCLTVNASELIIARGCNAKRKIKLHSILLFLKHFRRLPQKSCRGADRLIRYSAILSRFDTTILHRRSLLSEKALIY